MNELNFVTTSTQTRYLVIGDILECWHDFSELLQHISYNQCEEILVFGELLALKYPESANYDPMKIPAEKVYLDSRLHSQGFQLVSLAQPLLRAAA